METLMTGQVTEWRDLEGYLEPHQLTELMMTGDLPAEFRSRLGRELRSRLAAHAAYIPPQLVRDQLINPQPGRISGAFWEGALLFADLSGFTALSERLSVLGRQGAEEVSAVVNRLFANLLHEVQVHGGSLLKFGGDALTVFFDAAILGEHHAMAACAAALAMQKRMTEFANLSTRAGEFTLRLRVGVHVGRVFAAEVGDQSHIELLVTGPEVNRVALAQEIAAPGEVVVTEQTLHRLAFYRVEQRRAGFYHLLDLSMTSLPSVSSLTLPLSGPDDLATLNRLARQLAALQPYLIRANNDVNPGNESNQSTPYPNVRHIVLIGSDEVIPFFRLPNLTTIANEADYLEYLKTVDSRSNGASLISPNNPLGAALRNRMLLSDNPYGTDRPYRFYGFPLFVPELAVGRIVERPGEIADFLRRNAPWWSDNNIELREDLETSNSSLSLTGYDFLIDGANAISRTLQQATSVSVTKRVLNDNTWNRNAFENQWLEQPLSTPGFFTSTLEFYSRTQTLVSSLNAHFDHWQLIPAVTDGGNFPAERILSVAYSSGFGGPATSCDFYPSICPGFFSNTLYYSVGCHSGYNVPYQAIDQLLDIPTPFYAADFAQAFNRHAGNWIGNTGYGYGTLDGVDYSERLAALLTQELVRNEVRPDSSATNGETYVGRSIGDALVNAKLRYLRTALGLNAYDYKVLSITTLYGLPWKRIFVDNPLTASVEDLNAELPPDDRTAPTPIAGSQLTRTITFTINYDTNYLQPTRSGQLVRLSAENFTITDTFLLAGTFNVTPTVTVFNNNLIGMPGLPAFAYDITALSGSDDDNHPPLVVRDVIFVGGQYNIIDNFNPTVTQIVTETFTPLINTTVEPDFSAGVGFWLPDRFFGHSRTEGSNGLRDTLISTAAQFRATDGVTGTLRTYTQLVFQVIYTDPAATNANAALSDQTPPVIERVRIAGQDASPQSVSTPIEVLISDPDNPTNPQVTVTGVYLAADDVTWTPLTFTQDDQNPRRWVATVPRNWPDVRIIITAIDQAGNSVMYTAKGLFAPPTYQLFLPVIQRQNAPLSSGSPAWQQLYLPLLSRDASRLVYE